MTTQPCNTFRMEIPSGMTLPVMIAYQKAYEENREKNPLQSSENPAHHSELRLRLEQHSSYDDEQDDDGDDINSDDLESDDENVRDQTDTCLLFEYRAIEETQMLNTTLTIHLLMIAICYWTNRVKWQHLRTDTTLYIMVLGRETLGKMSVCYWLNRACGITRDTDNNEKEKEKEKEKDSTKPAGKSKQTSFMFKKDKAATTSVPKPVPETIELSDDEDDTDSREESEVVSLHRLSLASSTSTPSHSKGKERATADERKTWEEPSTKNTSSPEHNPEKKKKSKMILVSRTV
ncbi:hypothetical protein BDF14DRAFT_1012775 [Spinellus fusiger]|nr:hypothetical protein BDF14DRAFT_1012775 [Spinellus fusiger]